MPETATPQGLIREIEPLQELARDWTRLFPQAASQGEHWLRVLLQVQAHVSEDTCRLAVVGAVKSGKSTMINALVGQDLLRRGAGILTAMITRVQPGPEPRAVLQFKEWSEINGEIHRALGLLPSSQPVGAGRAPGPGTAGGPEAPGPGAGRSPGPRPVAQRQPGSELSPPQILPGRL